MILAGDIGGTKTILALYQQNGSEWECYKKEIFSSSGFDSFTELLGCFLASEVTIDVQKVCLGIAGPIVNGDCVATNLPWNITKNAILSKTGARHVVLLNDLEATAWGVLGLPESDFVELNSNAKQSRGNLAVLAAGTGLGEAIVVWDEGRYHVVATEGGHTDFAPRNKLEIGLLQYLMELHPEHVSYERVVCGQGLVDIYQYLKTVRYAMVDQNIESKIKAGDAAAVISSMGERDKDELCAKALAMFCEIYGAEAGNLALKCLPKGGVVLAGGIAAKIIESMRKGCFMQGYLSKGRYKEVLQTISVKVCMNSEAALLGAVNYSKKM